MHRVLGNDSDIFGQDQLRDTRFVIYFLSEFYSGDAILDLIIGGEIGRHGHVGFGFIILLSCCRGKLLMSLIAYI